MAPIAGLIATQGATVPQLRITVVEVKRTFSAYGPDQMHVAIPCYYPPPLQQVLHLQFKLMSEAGNGGKGNHPTVYGNPTTVHDTLCSKMCCLPVSIQIDLVLANAVLHGLEPPNLKQCLVSMTRCDTIESGWLAEHFLMGVPFYPIVQNNLFFYFQTLVHSVSCDI